MPNNNQTILLGRPGFISYKHAADPSLNYEIWFSGGRYVNKFFAGVSNPNYRRQIVERTEAGTPYSAADYELETYVPAHFHATTTTAGGQSLTIDGDGSCAFSRDASAIGISACDNSARTKFYQEAQQFNAATFLGELGATVSMLKSPAKALRASIDQLRHRNLIKRKGIVESARAKSQNARYARREYRKAASDTYLEWKFGVAPLISDMEDIYQTVLKRLDEPHTERVIGGAKSKHTEPRELVAVHDAGEGCPYTRSTYVSTSTETEVTYRASVHARVDATVPILQSLGLMPESFVPAAWELMPYSFLIDYVTNTGDVINAWATARSLRYAYCNKTVRVITRSFMDCRWDRYKDDGGSLWIARVSTPGMGTVKAKSVNRTVLYAVPLPSWEYTGPLSTGQSLNVVALVNSREQDYQFKHGLRR